jgi:cytochrome c
MPPFLVALLSLIIASPAFAQEPRAERGRVFLQANCAQCHSIALVGPSPLPIAPPFRDLHKRYPVESLTESLAEGMMTGHPTMPEFRLDPPQITDVLAYLRTLER